MTWPQISFVAEDHKGRIVGYVLAKMFVWPSLPLFVINVSLISEDDEKSNAEEIHGHVNSISVLRSYRRLGLAKKLMLLSRLSPPSPFLATELNRESLAEEGMSQIYKAKFCSLHVRKSNIAAIALYRDTLGFKVEKVEKGYCEYSIFFDWMISGSYLQTAMEKMVWSCGYHCNTTVLSNRTNNLRSYRLAKGPCCCLHL